MNRIDLQQLAELRIQEAELLLNNGFLRALTIWRDMRSNVRSRLVSQSRRRDMIFLIRSVLGMCLLTTLRPW